jgi:hypothetical protein
LKGNELFLIESAKKPFGTPTSRPIIFSKGDRMRFWSRTLDINVKPGSAQIQIENKQLSGPTGPTGPIGPTGPTYSPLPPIIFNANTVLNDNNLLVLGPGQNAILKYKNVTVNQSDPYDPVTGQFTPSSTYSFYSLNASATFIGSNQIENVTLNFTTIINNQMVIQQSVSKDSNSLISQYFNDTLYLNQNINSTGNFPVVVQAVNNGSGNVTVSGGSFSGMNID